MNIYTGAMKANELAFAIVALNDHADVTALKKALVALIGREQYEAAICAARSALDTTII